MTTIVARHAFATLALSAKLHRLLDVIGERHARAYEHEVQGFDRHLDDALQRLEVASPVRKEARLEEFSLLKHDFAEIERLYGEIRQSVPETAAQRFDRIFSEIQEKIKEKELTL